MTIPANGFVLKPQVPATWPNSQQRQQGFAYPRLITLAVVSRRYRISVWTSYWNFIRDIAMKQQSQQPKQGTAELEYSIQTMMPLNP